jgi:membrane protease YdiL (CAAX protease family)
LVSILVGVAVIVVTGWDAGALTDDQETTFTGVSGIAQFGGFGLLLWLLLRYKGGGIMHDLGVRNDREIGPVVACFIAGFALQFVLGIMVLPIVQLGDGKSQELVDQLENSSGLSIVLLGLMAGLLAPIFEELLFRGVLLRSLLRRMPVSAAVLTSAVVFGAVHLFDPKAFPIQPALIGMGIVSAMLAVYGGGLTRSIALHAGFNFVTVLVAILA